MKRLAKLTLKREIFLICLTYSLSFTLVFILIFGSVLFSSKLCEMKQRLQASNLQMKTYMDTLFDNCAHIVAYLEITLDLDTTDTQEQQKNLDSFQNVIDAVPTLIGVYVGYSDGTLLINNTKVPEGYDASARPWYKQAAALYPEIMLAYPYQEYTTGKWCFSTAKALVNDAGEITAVVSVDFPVDNVYESSALREHYESQTNYLIRENGECIYHVNKEMIGTSLMDHLGGTSDIFHQEEGYLEYMFFGEKRIAYFYHLDKSGNILVSAVNESDVIQPAVILVLHVLLGLMAISVIMSYIFMKAFERGYAEPVKLLKTRLASLLEGKSIPAAKSRYYNHEIMEIADSMEELTKITMNRKAKELHAILESSNDGILVLNSKQQILHYNSQLIKLWGLSENTRYQTYDDLALHQHMVMGEDMIHDIRDENEIGLYYLKTGIVLERYTRVLTEQEHIDGILYVYRDVTEKMKEQEHLKEIANTDFLTGLSNRRYFSFQVAHQFRNAQNSDSALALLMLDIDKFKRINDTYGHDVGDRALKAFAMHLRQCSRTSDILGRYGGEEFCALLPYTTLDEALQIAERMRLHFENASIDYRGSRIRWTVSIGVAVNDTATSTLDDLIKHSDLACYAAKQRGRNRVEAYSPAMAQPNPEPEP